MEETILNQKWNEFNETLRDLPCINKHTKIMKYTVLGLIVFQQHHNH